MTWGSVQAERWLYIYSIKVALRNCYLIWRARVGTVLHLHQGKVKKGKGMYMLRRPRLCITTPRHTTPQPLLLCERNGISNGSQDPGPRQPGPSLPLHSPPTPTLN